MPYKAIQKFNGRYKVVSFNPDGSVKNTHMKDGTRSAAYAQVRLLKKAKYGKQSKKYA